MSGLKCLLFGILGSEEYPVAATNGAAGPSKINGSINTMISVAKFKVLHFDPETGK